MPNKLVYSGIFSLEHERAYARLLGRTEYVLRRHLVAILGSFGTKIDLPLLIFKLQSSMVPRKSESKIYDGMLTFCHVFLYDN